MISEAKVSNGESGDVYKRQSVMYDDHQCSGYDVECCSWSNLPDEDFALADDCLLYTSQFRPPFQRIWVSVDLYVHFAACCKRDFDFFSYPYVKCVFQIIHLAVSYTHLDVYKRQR